MIHSHRELLDKHGDVNVWGELAMMWRHLKKSERAKYKTRAKADRVRYDLEMIVGYG
jgi:hypothetical protein